MFIVEPMTLLSFNFLASKVLSSCSIFRFCSFRAFSISLFFFSSCSNRSFRAAMSYSVDSLLPPNMFLMNDAIFFQVSCFKIDIVHGASHSSLRFSMRLSRIAPMMG